MTRSMTPASGVARNFKVRKCGGAGALTTKTSFFFTEKKIQKRGAWHNASVPKHAVPPSEVRFMLYLMNGKSLA